MLTGLTYVVEQFTFNVPWPLPATVFAAVSIWNWRTGRRERMWWRAALWAYLSVLAFHAVGSPAPYVSRINLIPLWSIRDLIDIWGVESPDIVARQILMNLLFLAPLGFLLPFATQRWTTFGRVMLLCTGTALGVELLQGLFTVAGINMGKTADIDNVILDVLGAALGYALSLLVRRSADALKRRPTSAGTRLDDTPA